MKTSFLKLYKPKDTKAFFRKRILEIAKQFTGYFLKKKALKKAKINLKR